MMRKLRKLLLIFLFFISIITIQYKYLFPDFIIDEEEEAEEEKGARKIENGKEKLPRYIVRNIAAEVIPDIKGAVKITWDVHKDSDDDYIVGRSISVPDTMEKVLKAISVKLIPAGAKTEAIDSNLKPGAYYYCVVARSKIMDREINLYAAQNYTISPVIIEKDIYREPELVLPQQVSLIYTRIINNNQVRITWRGIEQRGIVYTIYRNAIPLDSPAKLAQAEKIKVITDGRESYVDSSISKSGTYYYAITTKDISGREDLNLIPEHSYTISGVYVSLEVPAPVGNISVKSVDDGVKISWNKTSSGVLEFLIYRYSNAISDSDRLGLSAFIGRVPAEITVYYDKNPGAGNFYYAVLTKFLNGKVLNELVKGENYTLEPVVLGSQIRLLSLTARSYGMDIELTWKINGNLGNKSYKILRKEARILNPADLLNADIVAYINIFDHKYTDKNLKEGNYYYAIVPESIDNNEKLILAEGVNVSGGSIVPGKTAAEAKTTAKKILPAERPAPRVTLERSEPQIAGKRDKVKESVSSLNAILQKYFFKEKYIDTLIELENYIKNSTNVHDIAKARLFIGRTFIELKNYDEAMRYLALKDVNEQFPREAQFWRDFVLLNDK